MWIISEFQNTWTAVSKQHVHRRTHETAWLQSHSWLTPAEFRHGTWNRSKNLNDRSRSNRHASSVSLHTWVFFHSFTITTLVQTERHVAAECVWRRPRARFLLPPSALLPRVSFFRADRRWVFFRVWLLPRANQRRPVLYCSSRRWRARLWNGSSTTSLSRSLIISAGLVPVMRTLWVNSFLSVSALEPSFWFRLPPSLFSQTTVWMFLCKKDDFLSKCLLAYWP